MYLVLRTVDKNKIPVRIYENLDRAKEFIKTYISDSSKEWHYYIMGRKSYCERYYRYIKKYKNGKENVREEIYITYMKLY